MSMSKSKPNNRSRDPPPVLFLHPSTDASPVSVTDTKASTAPVIGHKPTECWVQSSKERSTTLRFDQQHRARAESSRGTDKTDALWAEMQVKLEEVDLSASNGTYVFGSKHSQMISELRCAQIRLAHAWARSEADEVAVLSMRNKTAYSNSSDEHNALSDLAHSNVENRLEQARQNPEDVKILQTERLDLSAPDLNDKSEMDIALGRERRDENDKYFQRVKNGVVDVVAKLKAVTVAMHAVEQQGQCVWNEVGRTC